MTKKDEKIQLIIKNNNESLLKDLEIKAKNKNCKQWEKAFKKENKQKTITKQKDKSCLIF